MKKFLLITHFFVFSSVGFAYAVETPSPAQTSGGVTRQQQDIEQRRGLEKRIQQEPLAEEEAVPAPEPAQEQGPGIFIKEIRVEGVTLLSTEEIQNVTSQFIEKELTLDQMQEAADRITELYRQKGFITSRAYLPVQSIVNGVLVISVVEVKSGEVNIQGNRYFKGNRLREDLDVQPGGYFDFSALQRSLVYINEHPDRKAKATLVPGKEPGTTDIIVEIFERRPFHAGFEYDNYGSRFIKEHRYSLVLEHTNLLGFDDRLYLKGQISQDSRMTLQQLRYLFPATPQWDLGAYAINTDLKLAEEFDALDAEGDAQIFGVFATRRMIRSDNVDLRLNLGFDYKSIENELLGAALSEDELRVLKAGFDLDFADSWGRNILAAEINSGLADFWGASEDKDPLASRAGAGGRFDKGNFTYFRLQPLPYELSLLWKNLAQATNHTLTASEQFQIGGAWSVRGYPPAEHSGDNGIYSALEISSPFYFISRNARVPLTRNEKLYDALRFVIFYDIATTHLNRPLAGEESDETLRGYGVGIRLNVLDNLSFRVEVGFPHGKEPSDGDDVHPWVELKSRF